MNKPPKRIRVTSTITGVTDGQTIGTVSKWLDDVTPLTANPNYKSDFVDDYKHPQQLYARFEQIAAAVPGHRRDRGDAEQDQRLPAQGAGDDRLTTGTAAQSAVVVSSAAWGHEGGNGITVEFVNRPGADLPLAVEVIDRKRCACCWPRTPPARWPARRRRSRPRSRRAPQGLIDRAHPYRTNAGTGIVQATTAPVVADRLPRPEARRRARGRGPARPVHDPRAADRQAPRRLQAGRADPGSRPRPRVGADDDHARDRRAARAQLRDRRGDQGHRREHRHLPDPVEQPGRRELLASTTSRPSAGT